MQKSTEKRASIFNKKDNDIELMDNIATEIFRIIDIHNKTQEKIHNSDITNSRSNGTIVPYKPLVIENPLREAMKLLIFSGMKLERIVLLEDAILGVYTFENKVPTEYLPKIFKTKFEIFIHRYLEDIEEGSVYDLKSVSINHETLLSEYLEEHKKTAPSIESVSSAESEKEEAPKSDEATKEEIYKKLSEDKEISASKGVEDLGKVTPEEAKKSSAEFGKAMEGKKAVTKKKVSKA